MTNLLAPSTAPTSIHTLGRLEIQVDGTPLDFGARRRANRSPCSSPHRRGRITRSAHMPPAKPFGPTARGLRRLPGADHDGVSPASTATTSRSRPVLRQSRLAQRRSLGLGGRVELRSRHPRLAALPQPLRRWICTRRAVPERHRASPRLRDARPIAATVRTRGARRAAQRYQADGDDDAALSLYERATRSRRNQRGSVPRAHPVPHSRRENRRGSRGLPALPLGAVALLRHQPCYPPQPPVRVPRHPAGIALTTARYRRWLNVCPADPTPQSQSREIRQ